MEAFHGLLKYEEICSKMRGFLKNGLTSFQNGDFMLKQFLNDFS